MHRRCSGAIGGGVSRGGHLSKAGPAGPSSARHHVRQSVAARVHAHLTAAADQQGGGVCARGGGGHRVVLSQRRGGHRLALHQGETATYLFRARGGHVIILRQGETVKNTYCTRETITATDGLSILPTSAHATQHSQIDVT